MLRGGWASSCCVAALMAAPAAAQTNDNPPVSIGDPVASAKLADEPDQDAAGGPIVVTGTRIVRPNNRSAAPIVTTTAAEIAAQGATTIEEVTNRLPQVQVNSEQNFSDSEGRQR